ncbi:MAG: alanine racemase, partial [Firmicutes bacterium]|nr:alanine racemase [Bacillota bacterium]
MQIPAYIENWLEVDLDAVRANAAEIRRHLPAETRLCAVVKADAYGLGAVEVARALYGHVDLLAVTSLAEAIELRRAEVKGDILVFTPLREGQAELFRRHRLTATVDA